MRLVRLAFTCSRSTAVRRNEHFLLGQECMRSLSIPGNPCISSSFCSVQTPFPCSTVNMAEYGCWHITSVPETGSDFEEKFKIPQWERKGESKGERETPWFNLVKGPHVVQSALAERAKLWSESEDLGPEPVGKLKGVVLNQAQTPKRSTAVMKVRGRGT